MAYTVNHYWQNPRNNSSEQFANLKDAKQALHEMSSEEEVTGVTTLEGKGKSATRKWNKKNARWE